MAVAEKTGEAVGAHLVGGIKADDAEQAMRAVADTLGKHVYAITDGETGPRSLWIGWQIARLAAVDGVELAAADTDAGPPTLVIGQSLTDLPPRAPGYADAAEASYRTFRQLRDAGVIAEDVKFQVSMPTPLAPIVAFVRQEDQERFYPIYAAAMEAEVADIAEAIPAEDLLLQFDVAVEIGVLCGDALATAAGRLADKAFMIEQIRRMLDGVPAGVEHGIHLCYGDFEHTHFAVPQDLSLCVEFANALGGSLDFVHMPVDRETGCAAAYHEPLRELSFDGRLALGVIDYRGDDRRTRDLIAAAATHAGRPFAVATECGMARIDQGSEPGPPLQRLLDLHAAFAEPVR